MSYFCLTVTGGQMTKTFTRFGRSTTVKIDGFVAKADDSRRWYVQTQVRYAHRWKSREKAEAAAVMISALLPDLIGSLRVDELERWGKGLWKRKLSTCTA